MRITNTQKGPRGVNAIGGPVLINPDETVEVEVHAREKEHLDASGWFEIEGDYTDNPAGSDKDAEIARLTAELAALKGDGGLNRDDLKAQAAELGLEYAPNITTPKLKELIDAKLAAPAGA